MPLPMFIVGCNLNFNSYVFPTTKIIGLGLTYARFQVNSGLHLTDFVHTETAGALA